MAEPFGLEPLNPLLTLDSVMASEAELERAYALCPTDHRLTAWLAPIKVRMGRTLNDAAMVQEGLDVLEVGVMHYPGFVLFSKFLVYADLPASDPDFQNAVQAVRDNVSYCGTPTEVLSKDPACNNHPRASHNIEGALLVMGDMYAKAQDKAAARAAYESATRQKDYGSWGYKDVLTQRLQTLDARVASFATESTLDDPESAWGSSSQCSYCHRD